MVLSRQISEAPTPPHPATPMKLWHSHLRLGGGGGGGVMATALEGVAKPGRWAEPV